MSLRLTDLPPWAREQALHKLVERQNRERTVARAPAPAPGKYYNERERRVLADGSVLTFDSRKEARRFDELQALRQAGKIRDLKLQPQFTLQEAYTTVEGVRVRAIRYQADFSYERLSETDQHGAVLYVYIVEDVKSAGTKTRVYEIKKKLMCERFGIEISEV